LRISQEHVANDRAFFKNTPTLPNMAFALVNSEKIEQAIHHHWGALRDLKLKNVRLCRPYRNRIYSITTNSGGFLSPLIRLAITLRLRPGPLV